MIKLRMSALCLRQVAGTWKLSGWGWTGYGTTYASTERVARLASWTLRMWSASSMSG
ncbi:hypothetical protein ACWDWO_07420 [Actinopolymorpha singaporensis]|uniref:hypothetical protein n=1 Tax=Actinopolymorpha singaporensis TaxID=117157 RepID=UPI0012FDB27C|nr:hypothetical protein [Actinopolymorpha singaporensis]